MDGFYDYLLNKFGQNEPIFLKEISYQSYSAAWINKKLSELVSTSKIIRYESGIYYIPKETILGFTRLDPRKIIEKKYIKNNSEIIGYYSGYSFLNMSGLTTQVPNTFEIYTNEETSKVREISIGKTKVILRKSRVKVNSNNAYILSFLEMMNFIDSKYIDSNKLNIIKQYIATYNIRRKDITTYAPYFPDKAMRTLIESEIIYFINQ